MNPYQVATGNMFREYRPMSFTKNLAEGTQVLRERYDTNLENHSLLDRAIGSIRTLDSDAERAKVNAAKYDIENNIIGGRVDYENMGKVIRDASTRLIADHGIQDAVRSYENYQQELEENAKLTAQGHRILDFNMVPVKGPDGKIMFNPDGSPMMEHRTKQWDSSTMGVYQRGSETKTHWDVKAQQLIQGIESDTLSPDIRNALIAADVDPSQLGRWLKSSEGLTEGKIREIAKALTSVFKFTTEGAQMDRFLQQLSINPETKDLYTPEQAEKEIEKFLFDIALKQKGIKSRIFQAAKVESDELPPTQDYLTTHAQVPESPIAGITDSKGLGKLFNDKGEFKEKSIVRSEPRLSARLKKIEEGIRNNDVKWADFTATDFARFAMSDNDFTRAFPRASGETDKAYTERLADVMRNRPTGQELKPTSRKEAASFAEFGLTNGVLYQESGNAYKSLEGYLEENSSTFGPWKSTLKDALQKSLMAEQKGEPVDGQTAGSTTLITSGKNAGKFRHTYYVGNEKKSVIISPVQGMDKQFALLSAISTAQSSLNPFYESVISTQSGTLEIRNRPSKDGKSIETYLVDDGVELDPSAAAKLNVNVILGIYRNSGTDLERMFTFQMRKNERKN